MEKEPMKSEDESEIEEVVPSKNGNLFRKWSMFTEQEVNDLKTENIILKKEINETLQSLQMEAEKVAELRKELTKKETRIKELEEGDDFYVFGLLSKIEVLEDKIANKSRIIDEKNHVIRNMEDNFREKELEMMFDIEHEREVGMKWKKRCKWWKKYE